MALKWEDIPEEIKAYIIAFIIMIFAIHYWISDIYKDIYLKVAFIHSLKTEACYDSFQTADFKLSPTMTIKMIVLNIDDNKKEIRLITKDTGEKIYIHIIPAVDFIDRVLRNVNNIEIVIFKAK